MLSNPAVLHEIMEHTLREIKARNMVEAEDPPYEGPFCHCGKPASISYRIKPYPKKEPISVAGRRANGAPYLEYACDSQSHQRQVMDVGAILDSTWIGSITFHRRIKDDEQD